MFGCIDIRPTHDKIHDLEQDLDRLRTFLTGLSTLPPESSAARLRDWSRSGELSTLPVEGVEGGLGPQATPKPPLQADANANVTPSGAQYNYDHGR